MCIRDRVLINYIVDELGGVVSADYSDPKGQGRITVVGAPAEEPEAPADWRMWIRAPGTPPR